MSKNDVQEAISASDILKTYRVFLPEENQKLFLNHIETIRQALQSQKAVDVLEQQLAVAREALEFSAKRINVLSSMCSKKDWEHDMVHSLPKITKALKQINGSGN